MDEKEPREVLEFPCKYPLKVMGLTGDPFERSVLEILRRHVPDLDPSQISSRESRKGKYTSLTVPFIAKSRQQLDALYQDLTACEAVSVAL